MQILYISRYASSLANMPTSTTNFPHKVTKYCKLEKLNATEKHFPGI